MRRGHRLSAFERLVRAIVWVSGHVLESDCWEWPKSVCNKGYGKITVAGVARRCHIVMWELTVGRRVRKGYTLDHLCRNKRCFRPTHMEEVTRSVNTARGNYANPRSTEHLRRPRDKQIPVADHQQLAVREKGGDVREPGVREESHAPTPQKQT